MFHFLFVMFLVLFLKKNYQMFTGYPLWEVPSCVRATLHKTVFDDPWAVNERSMGQIIWEMYKEVGRFYEGEFYHVPDLQYYVKKLYVADLAPHVLVRNICTPSYYPYSNNPIVVTEGLQDKIWGYRNSSYMFPHIFFVLVNVIVQCHLNLSDCVDQL